jgi:mono/diheme cytochrome c family protein
MIVPSDFRRLVMSGIIAVIACFGPTRSQAVSAGDAQIEARRKEAEKVYRNEVAPFLKAYCVQCHGSNKAKGGISFTNMMKRPEAKELRGKWQNALANVREQDMPPPDAVKQPTEAERKAFVTWVGMIKFLSPEDPGPYVIRRLTKAEYGNTLHDLFGVDPSVAAELPDDVAGPGYLNTLSPLQMEQYLAIANTVLDRALGSPEGPPTERQQKLFGKPPESGNARDAARKVARTLARSVYRRPANDEEIETLLKVFDLARANKLSYMASLRLMLKAMLVSPQFLFITPAKDLKTGETIVSLDDHHLASRLSYFLWATMPDAELAALADSGKLHEPEVLRTQVKRMLGDRRARALFDGFGAQWLGLGSLQSKTFDTAKFPQMTPAMRTAMYEEARLFFESIVRENRSIVAFVDSDYTFLNGTLAQLYGLEKTITGPEMRRVKLTDANRGGILGMPGVLAVTSFPERTSAVKRGVWVLEQVLGQHVPPAPANVPPLEKQDRQKVAKLTLRQRTELHRKNPACANCHKVLDPIGFGLENFDAIGRWRDKDDSGGPIDAAGELPGGKRFSSPKELKVIIAGRKEELARNLTEKLLAYALCRELEGFDEIIVDRLMESLTRDEYRMQSLIIGIVTSYPFLNRHIPTPPTTNAK